MRLIKIIFSSFIFTTIFSCETQIKSDFQFAYTVDKKGVYLYSLTDNKSNAIYKTDKVFLDKYFKQINDNTLQVGHQSEMQKEQKNNYDYLRDSIYHINLKTKKSFLATVIDHKHYDNMILEIITRNFNEYGKLISEKDTSYVCNRTSISSQGIEFCNFKRYYGESETILGKTIITEDGDLILKEGNKKSVLLKFDGHFDPKFGSGYYNPTLTSDSKKTSFQYLAGFFNNGSCIYEMDIETKIKTELIGEGFFNPLYSPDNKLLLLFSNNRQSKGNTWIKDIYIFDIETKRKKKIGIGENYLWIKTK